MTMPLDIRSTVAVLEPGQEVTPVTVSPALFEELDRDFNGFRGRWLVMTYRFETHWPTWERHPAGDEIVYLLSGDVEMVLETAGGERRLRLNTPGSYCIVPRNTWHTARPLAATEMLFITPGEGTENRPA